MKVFRQPGAAVPSADSQVVRMVPGRLGATRNVSAVLMPRGAAGVVARSRLISQICAQQRTPEICLLIAPIGCGKSNLLLEVAEHFRTEGRSVVWLSLNASHSVPEGFLAALDQVFGCKTATGELPAGEPTAWAHAAAQQLVMTISQTAATRSE